MFYRGVAMKVLDLIFAILLGLSVALQLNDPDPIYWVAVYGLATLVPVLSLIDKRSLFAAALALGMIFAGLIDSAPGFVDYLDSGNYASITGSMRGAPRYVEYAREFLGLLLAGAAMIWYALRWR